MDFLLAACGAPEGLAFPDFMAAALYHPDGGYYATGRDRVGRSGDFFTSVSVGPCFGMLLAARLAAWWAENRRPERWILMEQGAHDGRLLADILANLPADALASARVRVIEPFRALQALQTATLAPWRHQVSWQTSPGHAPPADCPVVFLANELLDAFPVERLMWRDQKWLRLHVVATGDADRPFDWLPVPLPGWLAPLAPPPTEPPRADGYTTEVCPAVLPWSRDLARAMPSGLAILIDYGFEAPDYHHPSRRDGTLRTYHRHQAIDNPFAAIGNSDITAHVNWSAVADALRIAGFSPSPVLDQGRWLTRLATPWLLSISAPPTPAQAKLLRQFQTLTHPYQMGGKFQVLEALI